jgi:NMD protein affecting ribosome stability and mRNA decay
MTNAFYNNGSIRMPRRSAAERHEEYGVDGKGIEECPTCKNVYYQKRWVHSIDVVKEKDPEAVVAKEMICPACVMITEHLFEGEVTIEEIPENLKTDISGIINNFGTYSLEHDPQARIIDIEDSDTIMRVTTTENQMAERLGKKINSALKNSEISITHSKEPYEVTRVHITFA